MAYDDRPRVTLGKVSSAALNHMAFHDGAMTLHEEAAMHHGNVSEGLEKDYHAQGRQWANAAQSRLYEFHSGAERHHFNQAEEHYDVGHKIVAIKGQTINYNPPGVLRRERTSPSVRSIAPDAEQQYINRPRYKTPKKGEPIEHPGDSFR